MLELAPRVAPDRAWVGDALMGFRDVEVHIEDRAERAHLPALQAMQDVVAAVDPHQAPAPGKRPGADQRPVDRVVDLVDEKADRYRRQDRHQGADAFAHRRGGVEDRGGLAEPVGLIADDSPDDQQGAGDAEPDQLLAGHLSEGAAASHRRAPAARGSDSRGQAAPARTQRRRRGGHRRSSPKAAPPPRRPAGRAGCRRPSPSP